MAKDWTYIKHKSLENINKREESRKTTKREAEWNNTIRNTKKMTREELKKEGDEYLQRKQTEENYILAGVAENRLKSPRLLKQASQIKKSKEKER